MIFSSPLILKVHVPVARRAATLGAQNSKTLLHF